ncbi:MAG: intradiol ring-cleavage dioxygenase [Candidatus Hydrogenedentes bacterium]|nr:intradiol ring-cleavage dioxygenase [Candidatus Hydrogenedentota bacterium]
MKVLNTAETEILLRRRDAIAALGAGVGAAILGEAAQGRPASAETVGGEKTCILLPELTEGPYYLSTHPFRSDIREDRDGITLKLRLKVRDVSTCAPIEGATVEIWHADADGNYSGVNGATTTFLRGQQTSNDKGAVTFTTIYPGWYPGRTPHIHVKVHVGGSYVHTGQLFFDEDVTSYVYTQQPYATSGQADTANEEDDIYEQSAGQSLLRLRSRDGFYVGKLALGVQPV